MTTQQELINNFKKICICKGITGRSVNKAIADGCLSFEAVRKKIGAGTGNCHAKRCREKIEKMIQDYRESTKIGA